MSPLAQHYLEIKQRAQELALACGRRAEDICLVAVSKGYSIDHIKEVYHAGCRHFGESRLQEALQKIQALPKDIQWHFIGTLQSNKARKVVSTFQWIHSVDTLELARKIASLNQELGSNPAVLLQVNISGEVSKHGLTAEGWEACIDEIKQLTSLHVAGFMTMAPLGEEQDKIRFYFKQLYQLRERMQRHIEDPNSFQHLSMGMSQDYEIAIQEGATLLRIGRAIFG